MAYIKVDHSKFSSAIKAINNYIDFTQKKMKEAETIMNSLESVWQGKDYNQYIIQWEKSYKDKDSTYQKMISALESYAAFLKDAQSKYKNAQSDAVNKANGLR